MMDMMTTVVPDFVLRLGWIYVGRNTSTTLESSTAVRTTAVTIDAMPRAKDRIVLLFLSSKAYDGGEAHFHAREVAAFLGLPWRRAETLERLHRVLSCRIELPTDEGWRPLPIAKYRIEPATGHVHVEFGREFRYASEGGAIYSLDIARKLVGRPADLDLYLMLETFLQRGRYVDRWYPYQELPAAKNKKKVMQQLRQRLARVNEVWPANPFRLIPESTALFCPLRRFKEIVFQRDEAEEARRMDQEVQSRNHTELFQYLNALPSWHRRRIIDHYLERELYKREMRPWPPPLERSPSATTQTASVPKPQMSPMTPTPPVVRTPPPIELVPPPPPAPSPPQVGLLARGEATMRRIATRVAKMSARVAPLHRIRSKRGPR